MLCSTSSQRCALFWLAVPLFSFFAIGLSSCRSQYQTTKTSTSLSSDSLHQLTVASATTTLLQSQTVSDAMVTIIETYSRDPETGETWLSQRQTIEAKHNQEQNLQQQSNSDVTTEVTAVHADSIATTTHAELQSEEPISAGLGKGIFYAVMMAVFLLWLFLLIRSIIKNRK